jgi:uncharacterized membrane protein YbhN (UPF0104 family)
MRNKNNSIKQIKVKITLRVVGFEVLSAMVMIYSLFWGITPCSLLKVNRHFGGTMLLPSSRLESKPTKKPA